MLKSCMKTHFKGYLASNFAQKNILMKYREGKRTDMQ